MMAIRRSVIRLVFVPEEALPTVEKVLIKRNIFHAKRVEPKFTELKELNQGPLTSDKIAEKIEEIVKDRRDNHTKPEKFIIVVFGKKVSLEVELLIKDKWFYPKEKSHKMFEFIPLNEAGKVNSKEYVIEI